MTFKMKVMVSIAMAAVICTAAAVMVASNEIHRQGEGELMSKSRAILSRLESVRSYIASQGGLTDSIQKATATHPDGILSRESKLMILKQVPIFAAMKVGEENAEKEGYKFRVFSDEPRNIDNKATTHEKEIFKRFLDDPKLPEISEVKDGQVIVYRPVRLLAEQGCLTCHGAPSTSPWRNGKDILGYQMENWSDGKLHGVFAVVSSTAEIDVAEAVRALAQRSATSAKEISALISDSVQKIEHGHEVVQASGVMLNEIVQQVEKLTALNIEISNASMEQSQGVNAINVSINDLDKVTQNNAAAAEESAAAAEALSSQSQQMHSMVQELIAVMDGQRKAA